jgi:hypothetical protein
MRGADLTYHLTNQPGQRLPGVMKKMPFEAVVADHGPTVLRVCLAVLGPIDADDAWSETFRLAMKAYPDPGTRQSRIHAA